MPIRQKHENLPCSIAIEKNAMRLKNKKKGTHHAPMQSILTRIGHKGRYIDAALIVQWNTCTL
jgi:hypothetical protein